MNVGIELLDGVPMPNYGKEGDSGIDIRAWQTSEPETLGIIEEISECGYELLPHERVLVKTGIKVEIPLGYEIQIRPRSGLSLKKGIVAQFGTIDSNYRGDLGIILLNTTNVPFVFMKGDRLAQIVLNKVEEICFVKKDLSETKRSDAGFGSSGIK